MPGPGPLLSLTLAVEIGEVSRFSSPGKLIGYAGLAPRMSQSGERSQTGALSKAGSRTLRWAAVEAANQAWRPSNPWHAHDLRVSARRNPAVFHAWCSRFAPSPPPRDTAWAMSEENVEVVRAMFDRFARGDFGRWFALTTDDFEFVTSPDIPDAGTYYGEEARRWMTAWVRSFEGHTLTLEATEIVDAGSDNVLAGFLQRGHPRGSERTVEGRWWIVVTFQQGAVARIENFRHRAEALEAAGLSE